MAFKESLQRSLVKAIGFRIIGLVMCYLIIKIGSKNEILLALEINLSALIMYIVYERIWNNINIGKTGDE
jgi:hypothetical protein